MAPFKTPKVTSQANKIKNTSHCKKLKHTTNSVHIQVRQSSRDSIIHIIKSLSKKICYCEYQGEGNSIGGGGAGAAIAIRSGTHSS